MTVQAPTLMEDIERAGQEQALHLFAAIVSAVVSLIMVPLLGLVAMYSGYRLSGVMHRSWVGMVFVAVGLASVTLWVVWLVAVQLGYIHIEGL